MDPQVLAVTKELGTTLGPLGILIVLAMKWYFDARKDNGREIQQKLDALLTAQQITANSVEKATADRTAETAKATADRMTEAKDVKSDLGKVFDTLLSRNEKLETSIKDLSRGVDELGRNVAEQTIVLREWRASEYARHP